MKISIRKPLSFSEIGKKANQEDCIFPSAKRLNQTDRIFVLCDGMGGHENGEVASQTVCRALGSYLESHFSPKKVMTLDLFKEALGYAYDELDKKDTHAAKKMGTTMTCLCLHKGGYLVAHIGDSRIYHIRPSYVDKANGRLGILYQSSDHSLVNDLLKAGELTEEEAQHFPQKNVITRAMQPNLEHRHKADVFNFSDIKGGDYFFLCCDGVLEQLTNEDLCSILANRKLTDAEKLKAIKNICDDKTKDNFTCILIPIDWVKENADEVKMETDAMMASVEPEHSSEEEEDIPVLSKKNVLKTIFHTLKRMFHTSHLSE